MNPAVILLILRLLGAAILLGFVGVLVWFIYRDMKLTAASLAAEERPYGTLRVIASDSQSPVKDSLFPLFPLTSIGRGASNTIVLESSYASVDHAIITRRNGQWWLQDQGSRNGTLLNDVPVKETAVISAGDIIAIGGTHLKVEF